MEALVAELAESYDGDTTVTMFQWSKRLSRVSFLVVLTWAEELLVTSGAAAWRRVKLEGKWQKYWTYPNLVEST
jgi:hypothetical protein